MSQRCASWTHYPLQMGIFRHLQHILCMLTILISHYSSLWVCSSHFQISFSAMPPPHHLFSSSVTSPPPLPSQHPPPPLGLRQYKFPFIPVAAGWRHRRALPHTLASPLMPIYCAWQPLWSRGTSGVEYAYWKQGPPLAQTSVAQRNRWEAASSFTAPASTPRAGLWSYYKDLGKIGFCKHKLESGIKRHVGANDVIVVGMSSTEMLKLLLWKRGCVWVGLLGNVEKSFSFL